MPDCGLDIARVPAIPYLMRHTAEEPLSWGKTRYHKEMVLSDVLSCKLLILRMVAGGGFEPPKS